MKNNLKIGITGGIASGKSQAIAYLKEKGFPVFSCDAINAQLLQEPAYIEKLQHIFPDCVKDGRIDKKILAEYIFSSPEKRKILENIAHPEILNRLFLQLEKESGVVFAEVPLLLEKNLSSHFDKIIVLMRQREARKQAIMKRDGCHEKEATAKMDSQFPYEKAFEEGVFSKEKFILIFNDLSLENLYEQLDIALKDL